MWKKVEEKLFKIIEQTIEIDVSRKNELTNELFQQKEKFGLCQLHDLNYMDDLLLLTSFTSKKVKNKKYLPIQYGIQEHVLDVHAWKVRIFEKRVSKK